MNKDILKKKHTHTLEMHRDGKIHHWNKVIYEQYIARSHTRWMIGPLWHSSCRKCNQSYAVAVKMEYLWCLSEENFLASRLFSLYVFLFFMTFSYMCLNKKASMHDLKINRCRGRNRDVLWLAQPARKRMWGTVATPTLKLITWRGGRV